MADQAVIKMNPEKTLVEIETPDGQEWGPLAWPSDQLVVMSQQGSEAFLAILEGYDGLKSNTVYALVEVETLVEEDDTLTDPDPGDPEQQFHTPE
jgi:hypothetical protein